MKSTGKGGGIMLLKKLFRTMKLYKSQFISMIIMIALGIGIFVGFNMEWVSIKENTTRFFDETNFADYRISSEKGFSESDLKKIEEIKCVSEASRFLSVNADVKGKKGRSVALNVTENEKVSGFKLIRGEKYSSSDKDGIWLSDKFADANNIKLGDKITLNYKNLDINCKVKGLIKSSEYLICVRDSSQIMPDYDTFGFAYISPALYRSIAGFDFYPQINVLSSLSKKSFSDAVDDKLSNTTLVLTKDEVVSYAQSKGEADEGKTMGSVLPVLFLAIAVLTMVTTMHRLTAKEKTQIGTLKALGFKDKKIIVHYSSYAFIIGIIGSLIGTALGYGVAYFIMNPNGSMGTYFDMPYWKLYLPLFCIVILVLIIAVLTFIGFLSVKQMLKGTAADALRPYTPKKVKPLKIEKTKIFHKLSFGTRWNMRDIIRHKSRSAMSLLGIAGCTILIMGSFGMRDTMGTFMDMYYDGALHYSSRIYISENSEKQAVNAIKELYNSDSSQTMAVNFNDKTVSLDIYDTKNNLIRFPGFDGEYINIDKNGAFMCKRLAEEFGLEKGDTFTVSPFGTDKEYELRFEGIIRSVSENIVISKNYAENSGINYLPDSLYTKTDKADIKSDSVIKSVQSKQAVIDSFDTFMEIMNSMIFLLVFGAALLGTVVLYNLGVMSYTERYREMATLKVVGFKDKKIGRLLISQNIWLTFIGLIIGIPLGILTLKVLVDKLASEYEMIISVKWYTYFITTLITFAVSLFVSLLVAKKNKKIDMVEALKGAE